MGKNIIVMAMSTLPLNSKVENPELTKNYFRLQEDDNEGEAYYGQLEPTSKMILKKEKSLDKIIILATPKAQEPRKFIYNKKSKKISAVDFYLERMKISDEEKGKGKRVEVIDLDENKEKLGSAISETIDAIRQYWNINKNSDEINLWVDTQGGFRNVVLVMNAIISLLKVDGIKPQGIYSMDFNRDKSVQDIIDQTNTYKIFDFVSGVNEFSRYGRVEQLEEYYKSINKDVPKEIQKMKSIVESIQMCDMVSFDKNLREFREMANELSEKDTLLNIFWNQIKKDYGNLLSNSCTGLDIVAWFYKKKFYQQAITYIEAKMPKEWLNKKKIIEYKKEEDTEVLQILKEKLSKKYESDENMLVTQIAMGCFRWGSIVYEGKKVDAFSSLAHLKKGRRKEYKTPDKMSNMVAKIKDNKSGELIDMGTLHISVNHKVDANQVMDMILLYKLLKNERNNFNHMEETGTRADQETLGRVIKLFIDLGNEVYKSIG